MGFRLVLCFFSLVFLSYSEGWVAIIPLTPNKDYPGQCYYPDNRDGGLLIIDEGGTYIPPAGHCYKMTCYVTELSVIGCGSVSVDSPGCSVVKDTHFQFPDCCPRIRCE